MRSISLVLTVLLIVCARCISADEFVLGRVLSVDRNRGTVAVEVLNGAGNPRKTEQGSVLSPANNSSRAPQSPPAVIIIDRHLLPDTITVNSTVRIRGSFDTNRGQLSPPRSPGGEMPKSPDLHIRHHDDTTGVRHRIEKGSRPGGKQSAPKGGPKGSNGSHRNGGHTGGHHGR